MLDYGEIAYFVFLGYIGSVAYVFIRSDEWEDLTTFDSIKRFLLGGISGYIYQLLYSNYDFPNSVMCIVSGYMGVDFILAVINKFKPPLKIDDDHPD